MAKLSLIGFAFLVRSARLGVSVAGAGDSFSGAGEGSAAFSSRFFLLAGFILGEPNEISAGFVGRSAEVSPWVSFITGVCFREILSCGFWIGVPRREAGSPGGGGTG